MAVQQKPTMSNKNVGERARLAFGQLFGRASEARPEPSGPHTGLQVGEYTLGGLVGAGGVGHVYRANHVQTGQVAAVKVMNRPADSSSGAIRFMREVQALRQASSPHVVGMLGWGVTSEGHHFLAMELLDGQSLQELLRSHKRLAGPDVLSMVDHVAAGLHSAHERGIIHRDIKPSNLFLAHEPEGYLWKILDFGLSKISGGASSSNITKRHVVGTPGFLSPEQALGEPLDLRSDVFALATVTYCALTGSAPFWAEDPVGAVYRVVNEQPPAPSERVTVHTDVDLALLIGMSKHVQDRPPSAVAFSQLLRAAFAGGLPNVMREHAARVAASNPWQSASSADMREESWQALPTVPTSARGFG